MISDATINAVTHVVLGKWPSFEAQSWACKVVHAILAHQAQEYRDADVIMEKVKPAPVVDAAEICDAVAALSRNHLFRSGAKVCAAKIRDMQEQPAQEPIYQLQLANGSWIDQDKESYQYNVSQGNKPRIVYAAAQPAPAQQEVELLVLNDAGNELCIERREDGKWHFSKSGFGDTPTVQITDLQKLSDEEFLRYLADRGVGWQNGKTIVPFDAKEEEGLLALEIFDAIRDKEQQ